MTLPRIRLGSTDIELAPLGVGTMAWSRSRLFGYGDRLGPEEARGAYRASLEAGLTLFDTAEIYGRGKSERVVGELVGEHPDHRPLVATKYAPYPWRWSPRTLTGALSRSLERLGLDRVDLYQVHFPGGLVGIEKLMHAMADALEAGHIRAIGVSNYGAGQMRAAHEVLQRRGHALASNQVEYSLVQRSPEADGVLEACRELGVTLIAYSPLGRGVLSGKYRPGARVRDLRRFYGPFKEEALRKLVPLLDELQAIASAHGKTPAQVALNWLARQAGVLPIPGAKNEEQARQNAGSLGWDLSSEEADRLDGLSRPYRAPKKSRYTS